MVVLLDRRHFRRMGLKALHITQLSPDFEAEQADAISSSHCMKSEMTFSARVFRYHMRSCDKGLHQPESPFKY